jgi:hypothetical protein
MFRTRPVGHTGDGVGRMRRRQDVGARGSQCSAESRLVGSSSIIEQMTIPLQATHAKRDVQRVVDNAIQHRVALQNPGRT